MAGNPDNPDRGQPDTLVPGGWLTAIANQIRAKSGISNTMAIYQMPLFISTIDTTIGNVTGYQLISTDLFNGKLSPKRLNFYDVPINQILSLTVCNISQAQASFTTTFTARDIQYAFIHNYPVIMGESMSSGNGLISYYWKTTTAVAVPVPILVFDVNNVDITKTSPLGDACIFQTGSLTGVARTDTYPYSNYINDCSLILESSKKPLW